MSSHTCLTSPSTSLLKHQMVLYMKVLMEPRACRFMWKRDQVKALLQIDYLTKLAITQPKDGVIGSCIQMLHLIDGPSSFEECRLFQLLLQWEPLSNQNLSLIICWIKNTDPAVLKSLPSCWEFYMKLVDKLEIQLIDAASNCASHFQLVHLSALLISTYLKLEDEENLQWLVNRNISSNKAEWRSLFSSNNCFARFLVITVSRVYASHSL